MPNQGTMGIVSAGCTVMALVMIFGHKKIPAGLTWLAAGILAGIIAVSMD